MVTPSGAAREGGSKGLPASLANALFALFLGAILVYGAAFAWYMLGRFDLVNLVRDVNMDDSFYYYQIAYHMAAGKFSTFDGGITRTNGYHPLWLLFITPFYWIFDKAAALFAIKAFEIMLVAGGVSLVAAAARLARLPWILLFAALPVLYRQTGLIWGLEAAAGLFMLGLFLFTIVLFARDPARWRWPVAAVTFSLPWVRLEYAAISLASMAALLLIERSWQDRRRPGAGLRAVFTLEAMVPFLTAGAGLLVYFGYNRIVFGGIAPVSAAVKQLWSQLHWEREGGYDLTRNVLGYLQHHAFDNELWVVLEVFAYVLLVWWFAHRSRSRADWLLLAFLAGVSGLAFGHLAKFVQSVLTVHPDFGNYHWYFIPAYLMKAVMIPTRCYVAIWLVRRFIGPGLQRASRILSLGIVVSGAASLYATADFTAPFRFVDWRTVSPVSRWEEWNVTNFMGTMVMNRVLPEGSVVGSWDAGVIGYFSHHPVVNLDGLVNSYDYHRKIQDNYAGGEDPADISALRFGITHYANVLPIDAQWDTVLFEGARCCFDADRKGLQQFSFRSVEPLEMSLAGVNRSDWFWARLEPHFDRRQTDGIGLLVDGRLAQAFARDCMPDELAAWTGSHQGRKVVFRPWIRTRIGICLSTIVLPHDAFEVRP